MGKTRKTPAVLVLVAIVLLMALAACTTTPSDTKQDDALYGKPWTSVIFQGNLPQSAPVQSDDFYASCAYDYIAAHQEGDASSVMTDTEGELRTAVTSSIKDESLESPELAQLRIFYEQAADTEGLKEAGAEELKPHLKAVADTKTLDELEQLMLSEDFPFSPWIDMTVTAPDMTEKMCVGITPCLLFSDIESGSADMYLDSDDPETQAIRREMRSEKTVLVEDGLSMLSICADDKTAEMAQEIFELEKAYGKDTDQAKYLSAAYGEQGSAVKIFTTEELASAFSNFPIMETLAKSGRDKGDSIIVMYPEWVSSFNSIWTEENFEHLRAMTELKVLIECFDFLTPDLFAGTYSRLGKPAPTPDDVAWKACDRADTFTQLLAKTYVENSLGQEVVDELEALSNDLIDTYIELVDKTTWLNKESREKVAEKIDNMALNVLVPDGGYYDYSGLELVPSEEGGTLLGNYLALKAYNEKLESDLIGKDANASVLWRQMRPTVANCFYDSSSNSINIFPGFVMSSVYEKGAGTENLLAGMGFIVAHEISHAFDYSWSQFDAYGRPDPVFSEQDVNEYVALRQKLADYYAEIEVVPGKSIDGIAVSAEAVADLSGMQAICERAGNIEGFDYQKMFEKLGQTWATVYPEAAAGAVLEDVHAPANSRINVSVQMMDAFYETYEVGEDNGMYLPMEKRILMWGDAAN